MFVKITRWSRGTMRTREWQGDGVYQCKQALGFVQLTLETEGLLGSRELRRGFLGSGRERRK